MNRALLAAISGRTKRQPLVLDFRSAAATVGTTAPAGCGYTRAACVSTVQTGTSTLVDLTAFSGTANLVVRGRALDAWEYGLVLEEARTNLVPYSSDYTVGGGLRWTQGGTVTGTAGQLGPAGAGTATRLQATAPGDNRFFTATGLGASVGVTHSSWVTPNAPPADVAIAGDAGTDNSLALSVWERLMATGTVTAADSLYVVFGSASAGLSAGARDWLVYGSQIELGRFPSSYIPTAGSTATRNANFLPVLGSTWSSQILGGRVGIMRHFRPMGARSEYSGTRYLWWLDANNHVSFAAATGVVTVTIAGATNTTSALTWSRYADTQVFVEMGAGVSYVALLADGVRTVPSVAGSALGSLSAGDLYLGSSNTGGHTCAWNYRAEFYAPGTRPSWAW